MKRIFVILLSIVLLICGMISHAEGDVAETTPVSTLEAFEIRNGIKFGLSKDEVFTLEEEYGYPLNENHNRAFYGVLSKREAVTLAGMEGCTINYNFSQDDMLNSILYDLRLNGDTSKIHSLLCEKYGTPVINNGAQFLDLGDTPCAIDYVNNTWIVTDEVKPSNAKYSQWLYTTDEKDYVDVLLMSVDLTVGKTFTVNVLSYTHRTSEEIQSTLSAAMAKSQQAKDDL